VSFLLANDPATNYQWLKKKKADLAAGLKRLLNLRFG